MKIVEHPNCNASLSLEGCDDLPIASVIYDKLEGLGENIPAMISYWRPTPAEISYLVAGQPIFLSLLGQAHPPVMMGVEGISPQTDSVPAGTMAALGAVLGERIGQLDEYDAEHDDAHTDGEIAKAAAAYALLWADAASCDDAWRIYPWEGPFHDDGHNERVCLVRAGALILAEIERLDRQAALAADVQDMPFNPKVGDHVEFDSDLQTDKGPSGGRVTGTSGGPDKPRPAVCTIEHSDTGFPGETFKVRDVRVKKLTTYQDTDETLWVLR